LAETQITDPNAAIFNGELDRLTLSTGIVTAAAVAQGGVESDILEAFIAEVFSPSLGFAVKVARMLTPEGWSAVIDASRSFGARCIREALERAMAREREDRPVVALTPDDLGRLDRFLAEL
jgi:hypothetical protein